MKILVLVSTVCYKRLKNKCAYISSRCLLLKFVSEFKTPREKVNDRKTFLQKSVSHMLMSSCEYFCSVKAYQDYLFHCFRKMFQFSGKACISTQWYQTLEAAKLITILNILSNLATWTFCQILQPQHSAKFCNMNQFSPNPHTKSCCFQTFNKLKQISQANCDKLLKRVKS